MNKELPKLYIDLAKISYIDKDKFIIDGIQMGYHAGLKFEDVMGMKMNHVNLSTKSSISNKTKFDIADYKKQILNDIMEDSNGN